MAQAKRDQNRVPTIIGVSSADTLTPTLVAVDPTTNELLVRDDDLIGLLGAYAIRVAEDSGDSNVTYIGKAAVGSSESSAVWQIQKIDETSGTEITHEDGDSSFDNEWSERESGSYS